MANEQSADALFSAAIEKIESESIKKWAIKQKDVWIELGIKPMIKKGTATVDMIVVMITAEAIGLW